MRRIVTIVNNIDKISKEFILLNDEIVEWFQINHLETLNNANTISEVDELKKVLEIIPLCPAKLFILSIFDKKYEIIKNKMIQSN